MYDVADRLPVDRLDPATFLVSGPAMSGKYDLLVDLTAEGIRNGDAILFVTTNQDAGRIIDDVDDRLGRAPETLRIVDCASERSGSSDEYGTGRVEYVSSPADLTGIGIGVSEQLRRFGEADAERTRVAFYSISTLLMYTDVETVFRFLHVLTGRIRGIGGLGAFTIDPTTHDESTVNTLKQVFDGMIELREADGEREVRLVGVPDAPDGWMPLAT